MATLTAPAGSSAVGGGGAGGGASGGRRPPPPRGPPKLPHPQNCEVCGNDLEGDVSGLPCQHVFCTECIRNWDRACERRSVETTCPLCRQEFSWPYEVPQNWVDYVNHKKKGSTEGLTGPALAAALKRKKKNKKRIDRRFKREEFLRQATQEQDSRQQASRHQDSDRQESRQQESSERQNAGAHPRGR